MNAVKMLPVKKKVALAHLVLCDIGVVPEWFGPAEAEEDTQNE